MAFSSIGQFLGSSSKASSTTSVVLTSNSASLTTGRLGIIIVAKDNASTTDGNTSEVTSITDAAGNTWAKLREFCNGNGSANAGAVVSVWYTIATSNLGSGANVTINFSANTSAKAARGWVFSLGAGSTISVTGTSSQDIADDFDDVSAAAFSGLTNIERIWLRAIATEGDFGSSIFETSSFTPISLVGTGGGLVTANMCASGEFLISTSTGETSDPAIDFLNHASVFLAIEEIAGSSGGKGPILQGRVITPGRILGGSILC